MPGISVRAYARHRGISHTAVQKAIRAGRIVPLPNGQIDVAAADAAWTANTDQSKQRAAGQNPPAAPPVEQLLLDGSTPVTGAAPARTASETTASETYAQSRALREAFMARLAGLSYQQRARELVSMAEVETVAMAAARRARDLLFTITERLAPIVAGLSSPAECHQAIRKEIDRVCAEIETNPIDEGGPRVARRRRVPAGVDRRLGA